ncbi:AAA family ATPase, partial [Azospirillum brasilense]|nr:AAA family ATPase [Azospirillum brasilense]
VPPVGGPGNRLGAIKGQDLEEGVSTRLLVYCASLIRDGMPRDEAILASMIEPLTDDPEVKKALLRVAELTLG